MNSPPTRTLNISQYIKPQDILNFKCLKHLKTSARRAKTERSNRSKHCLHSGNIRQLGCRAWNFLKKQGFPAQSLGSSAQLDYRFNPNMRIPWIPCRKWWIWGWCSGPPLTFGPAKIECFPASAKTAAASRLFFPCLVNPLVGCQNLGQISWIPSWKMPRFPICPYFFQSVPLTLRVISGDKLGRERCPHGKL